MVHQWLWHMQNQLAPMGLLLSLRTFLSLLWGQQQPSCLLLQRVGNPWKVVKMGSLASRSFLEVEHSPERCLIKVKLVSLDVRKDLFGFLLWQTFSFSSVACSFFIENYIMAKDQLQSLLVDQPLCFWVLVVSHKDALYVLRLQFCSCLTRSMSISMQPKTCRFFPMGFLPIQSSSNVVFPIVLWFILNGFKLWHVA